MIALTPTDLEQASPLGGSLAARHKIQGRRVHAVAQSGRLRTIVEHVTQVPVAARATHLRARLAKAAVRLLDHVLLRQRLVKAGPTGAGFELRLRIE